MGPLRDRVEGYSYGYDSETRTTNAAGDFMEPNHAAFYPHRRGDLHDHAFPGDGQYLAKNAEGNPDRVPTETDPRYAGLLELHDSLDFAAL